MKRIHSFLVCQVTQSNCEVLEPSYPQSDTSCELQSWHRAWDHGRELVDKSVKAQSAASKFIIADNENLRIIAVFCQQNFENQFVDAKGPTQWSSSVLGATGYFANLDRSHYGWGWIPGAEREVPFRLNRLERHMERHPFGLVARVASLLAEARDLLIPT